MSPRLSERQSQLLRACNSLANFSKTGTGTAPRAKLYSENSFYKK